MVLKRYLREFNPAMAGCLIVLPISIALLQQFAAPTATKALVVLLPVLPMLLVPRAIMWRLQRLDERRQCSQIRAMNGVWRGDGKQFVTASP